MWGGGGVGCKCSNHPPPPGKLRPQGSQKIPELDGGIESKLTECDTDYKIGRFNKTRGGGEDVYKSSPAVAKEFSRPEN